MKTLDFDEAKKLIADIAAHCTIYVNVVDEFGHEEERAVLGNATVFDVDGKQIGISNNSWLAGKVLEIIENNGGQFRVHSSYFNYATGRYSLSVKNESNEIMKGQILEAMRIVINDGEQLTTDNYTGSNPSAFKEFAEVNNFDLELVVEVWEEVGANLSFDDEGIL